MNNFLDKIANLRETPLGSFVPVMIALVAIWVYFGINEPIFLSPRNFYYLFMQSAVVGTLAVGVTMVLLLGDIDLSIGAVAGVCAATLAVLTTNMGLYAPYAIIISLLFGAILGCIMGAIIAYVKIPSFVVTLAGLLGFQGLMMKILGINGAINVRDPLIRSISTTTLPTTIGMVLAIIGVVLFGYLIIRNRSIRSKKKSRK